MPSQASASSVARPSHIPSSTVRALFYIDGLADPGFLPRLLEPVSKLGHIPARVHVSSESGDGTQITVDLRVHGLTTRMAHLIEHGLRATVGVQHVVVIIEPDERGPMQRETVPSPLAPREATHSSE